MEIKVSVEDVDLTSPVGETYEYDHEGDYTGRTRPRSALQASMVGHGSRDEVQAALLAALSYVRSAKGGPDAVA